MTVSNAKRLRTALAVAFVLLIAFQPDSADAGTTKNYSKPVKRILFSPNDAASLVLVEERQGLHGGSFTFVPIDLQKMSRADHEEVISKAMDGRLRTRNPGLATRGEGLMIPKNMSRFSAAKIPAGDYALVGFSTSMLVYETFSCVRSGSPVYRFSAGRANLISADMLPAGGGSNTFFKFRTAANGSNNDLADAQEVINEYDTLKSEVMPAEFLGFVKFEDERGVVTGCGRGQKVIFEPKVEKAMQ